MKQVKLNWSDLINIWLWFARPNDGLVQDDTAYVALLRVGKYVEYALAVLENQPAVDEGEKK